MPVPRIKPGDVTGIQPRRVCAVKGALARKDLRALDPYDKHRDEEPSATVWRRGRITRFGGGF
ncbi:hypothetical protein DXM21_07030 [Agrobacterium rosae]|nr:hypothetical protein DXM21_07030 [Agrobacterium rosae]KAA3523177.1 hypothetical protein DXM25_07040 [Agrobacterium rosae]MQB47916.1 hypothetical protein [Agrobacterium rosae]